MKLYYKALVDMEYLQHCNVKPILREISVIVNLLSDLSTYLTKYFADISSLTPDLDKLFVVLNNRKSKIVAMVEPILTSIMHWNAISSASILFEFLAESAFGRGSPKDVIHLIANPDEYDGIDKNRVRARCMFEISISRTPHSLAVGWLEFQSVVIYMHSMLCDCKMSMRYGLREKIYYIHQWCGIWQEISASLESPTNEYANWRKNIHKAKTQVSEKAHA